MTAAVEVVAASTDGPAQCGTFRCGKIEADVRYRPGSSAGPQSVWVVQRNAAHRVWRGAGRGFASFGHAADHYKSGAMQAILEAARAHLAEGGAR